MILKYNTRKHLLLTVTQTSYRRAAATVCPASLLPRGRLSALRRRAEGNVAAVFFPTANMFSRPPLQPPDAPTQRYA